MSKKFKEDIGTDFIFSQCAYCLHNNGGYTCNKFGEKPIKYAENEVKCDERVVEEAD